MDKSENIGELIAALAKAQSQFTPALKESSNPFFSSKYADLATVIDAVRPALNKNGIALVQFNSSDIEHQTASVTTSLHFGEQWVSQTMHAPAIGKSKDGKEKFDVQTLGAAWTYLRRYGIQSICGLASEDDDGNSLQHALPAMDKDVKDAHLDLLDNAKSMVELERFYIQAVKDARKANDKLAEQEFTASKNAAKAFFDKEQRESKDLTEKLQASIKMVAK